MSSDTLVHRRPAARPGVRPRPHGDLLVRDGLIADFGSGLGRPDGAAMVAEDGAILCPGLVDMRAALGEPGYEYRETIASAAEAAAAGGITTLAALPDTLPAIDDPALVRLLRARGEETGSLTILPYGAVTRGCRGEELAELGLLARGRRRRVHRWQPRHRVRAADARRAVLCPRLRRPHRAASRGPVARRRRRRDRGRAGHQARPARHPGRRRGDPGRARHPAGGADRRGGAFRPCLHRRGAGADPPGESRRHRGHLRHRAALFRPQRDGDRRLPHLCQAVAAAAQGSGPAGGGGRAGRWHDRRHRLRPPAARCRRQAPALRPGHARRHRARHPARRDAGAGSRRRAGPGAGDRAADGAAGGAARRSTPGAWPRAGRPISACSTPSACWQVEAGRLPGKAQNTPFDGRALEGVVLGTWKAGRRVFG